MANQHRQWIANWRGRMDETLAELEHILCVRESVRDIEASFDALDEKQLAVRKDVGDSNEEKFSRSPVPPENWISARMFSGSSTSRKSLNAVQQRNVFAV